MVLKKIKIQFRRHDTIYLGVQQIKNSVYMVMLTGDESDEYKIIWQNQLMDNLEPQDLLAKACMLAASMGKENVICCLGLSQQEVYFYEKSFPEMDSRELKQAIKLDFVSAAAWQEPYWLSFAELADGNFRIGAIRKSDMYVKTEVCRNFFQLNMGVLVCCEEMAEELKLPEVWQSWPQGMQEAFYVALCGLQGKGLRFGKTSSYIYQWHWSKLTKWLWGICAGFAVCSFLVGWYMDCQLDRELSLKQHEIALLEDVAERQESIEKDKKIISERSKLLADVQSNNSSAYGTLIRLGAYMEDGIWLTGAKLEDNGNLHLQGRATAYHQIAQFLAKLTAKEKGMVLDSADRGQDGLVNFQLKGRLI